jgi:meiosis-specific protein
VVKSATRHMRNPPMTRFPADVVSTSTIRKLALCNDAQNVTEDANNAVQAFGAGDVLETATPSTILAGSITRVRAATPLQPQRMITPTANQSRKRSHRPITRTQLLRPSQTEDSFNTQASNALCMKGAFLGMMRPECMTQGDTQIEVQTQQLALSAHEARSCSLRHAEQAEQAGLGGVLLSKKAILLPVKAGTLKREKSRLRGKAFTLLQSTGKKTLRGELVLCQCGYGEEEGGMVRCEYCETWQHLPCYGYAGHDDPRLPDTHTCYRCLCTEDEQSILKTLEDLVVKRRVMDFALRYGIRTQKQLARDLGMFTSLTGYASADLCFPELDKYQAQCVFNFLKDEGFIVKASGANKAGYRTTEKPTFVAVREGPKHELMVRSLFDPLRHIKYHVSSVLCDSSCRPK